MMISARGQSNGKPVQDTTWPAHLRRGRGILLPIMQPKLGKAFSAIPTSGLSSTLGFHQSPAMAISVKGQINSKAMQPALSRRGHIFLMPSSMQPNIEETLVGGSSGLPNLFLMPLPYVGGGESWLGSKFGVISLLKMVTMPMVASCPHKSPHHTPEILSAWGLGGPFFKILLALLFCFKTVQWLRSRFLSSVPRLIRCAFHVTCQADHLNSFDSCSTPPFLVISSSTSSS